VVVTKSSIVRFAGPSFQDGNGSEEAAAAGVGGGEFVEHPAMVSSKNRYENDAKRTFILVSPGLRHPLESVV
jgi:hypothetical protein